MKRQPNAFSEQAPGLFGDSGRWPRVSRHKRPEILGLINESGCTEAIEQLIRPFYAADQKPVGRPGYPLRTMVRIWVARRMWSMSSRQTESALSDSISLARFVGIDPWSSRPPSATKIAEFDGLLRRTAATDFAYWTLEEQLESKLDEALRSAGWEFKPGSAADPIFRRISGSSRNA